MDKKNVTGAEGQNGLFASAVYDKDRNEYIVKVANTSAEDQELKINFAGMKKKEALSKVRVQTLSSADPDAENSIENPSKIVPAEKEFAIDQAQNWTTVLPAKTFAVYHFQK